MKRVVSVLPVMLFVFSLAVAQEESNPLTFTVNNPIASISALVPDRVAIGGSDFTLMVDGSNFVLGSVVRWEGQDRVTTFVNNTRLEATILSTDIGLLGTFNVTVFNPAPGGGESSAFPFQVEATPAVPLALTQIVPDNALAGGLGFSLTIQGAGFKVDSAVRWNGQDRPTTFVTDTELQAQITASDISLAGIFQVTVFNPVPVPGGTASCTGEPFPQTPVDLTAELGIDPNVTVMQMTDGISHVITYYDVPAYSPVVDRIVYYQPQDAPRAISVFNPDGSDSQSIVEVVGTPFMSYDRRLVVYDAPNPAGGRDIYGFRIDQNAGAPCQVFQITSLGVRAEQLSPPAFDATVGKYLIAFAPDENFYLVYDDGTGPGGVSGPVLVNLNDTQVGQTFHRIRLNPVFPHIIHYARNEPGSTHGEAERWVADLSTDPIETRLVWTGGPHPIWTPDGLTWAAVTGTVPWGKWIEVEVVNSDGTLKIQSELNPVIVGPVDDSVAGIEYCDYAPDMSVLACSGQRGDDPESRIFLMSRATGNHKYLARTNFLSDFWGMPWLQFFEGKSKLLFDSDRTGGSQVYVITGFTTDIP